MKNKIKKYNSESNKGFTLIEVMVALGVTVIALSAIIAVISQMITTSTLMQQKTFASWIAQNYITELRLKNESPNVGSKKGTIFYANSEWFWDAATSETGIEGLYRVDVEVGLFESDNSIQNVSGFIGAPKARGAANNTFNINKIRFQDNQ